MWVVGAVRSQVDVPIWQKRATRVAACLLAGGPDVPAKADGPPPLPSNGRRRPEGGPGRAGGSHMPARRTRFIKRRTAVHHSAGDNQ